MTTKKTGSKAPAKPKSPRAKSSKAPGAAADAPRDLEIGAPPSADDPKASAEYFMQLLESFAQQGSPEAKRIRSALIQAVTEFGATEDKAQAKMVLRARLAGVEMGVAELVVRATRKIRDRMQQESRRLGTSSKEGKAARAAAEGFTTLCEALDKMHEAAESGDAALRAQANALMEQARSQMEVLQQP